MIVTLKTMLALAEASNSAVAAFNATSFDGARAVIDAAEEAGLPVILQFAPDAHEQFIPFKKIGPVMAFLAEAAAVPVCVHLDHGSSLGQVKVALDMGFSGVMFDGSPLPLEANIAQTAAAVEAAHRYGVSVEGEIGAMGREESESVGGEGAPCASSYTDPDMAAEFARATGVDALACSFGTVHGIYVSAPVLDFDRIAQIRQKARLPVVMHGGSGISDDDFRKCIANGVRKINYYTYAAKYAGEAARDAVGQKGGGNVFSHDIYAAMHKSLKETFIHTMKVFAGREL